jgi:hypothetical protein
MSLPGLMAQPIIQAGMLPLGPLDTAIAMVNTNPYFIGLMMLILNLGGRFLALEITKEQEQFFQNQWVRRGLIFIVFFVATRSIVTAFWLTLIAVLLLGYLFNENSSLCVWSGSCAKPSGKQGGDPQKQGGGMTPEEQEILRRLSEKYQRYNQPQKKDDAQEEDADASEVYMANMELLHN